MLTEILTAIALVLVLEGLMPFLSPATFRRYLQQLLGMPDHVLRNFALGMMVAGALLLYLVR